MRAFFKSSFLPGFLLALGYFFAFYALQYLFHLAGIAKLLPNDTNLCSWDAGFYRSIGEHGYEYDPNVCKNSGFYVLLGWVWRITRFNAFGISILNGFLFSIGFGLLAALKQPSRQEQFIWLTTPSFFFLFVPYSEALFFIFASLLIFGIIKRNTWFIAFSLFMLALTRASFVFLLPALLAMELVSNNKRQWLQTLGNYALVYLLPTFIGFTVFVLYQYQATGVWFAYFKLQYKYMDHHFHIPVLPFSNLNNNDTIWVNYLAMFVGIVAFWKFIRQCFLWLLQDRQTADKILLLSFGYLGIVFMYIIFYNPMWGTNTTLLIGLHRYSLASPFFIVCLHAFLKDRPLRVSRLIGLFLACNIVWLLVGSYRNIQFFLFFNMLTFIVLLYELYATTKKNWVLLLIIGINMLMQGYLFQLFIAQKIFTD